MHLDRLRQALHRGESIPARNDRPRRSLGFDPLVFCLEAQREGCPTRRCVGRIALEQYRGSRNDTSVGWSGTSTKL
jgi:hypothetical protein